MRVSKNRTAFTFVFARPEEVDMKLLGFLMAATVTALVGIATVEAADCPKDSVRSGSVCIDRYEASVWQIKPQGGATSLSNQQQGVVDNIRAGTVTLADLNKIGAVQLGVSPTFPPEFVAAGCPASGAGCTNVYAVSIPGVKPSGYMTWFQAAAAARNSFKRLPTNAEWTVAALGTPDGVADDGATTCNTSTKSGGVDVVVNTGSRSQCVSDVGVFDMVGNVIEWVADWVPRSIETDVQCGHNNWQGDSLHGYQCLFGAAPSGDPGALWRGSGVGDGDGSQAGVYAISGLNSPAGTFGFNLGFHAVR
jgi:hypothetical protein